MIRQAEIFRHLDAIETIANQHLISFFANVAKALVTLVILATKGLVKLSYLAAIFATNRVATNNREQDINPETTNLDQTVSSKPTNKSVSMPIFKDLDDTIISEVEESEQQLSKVTATNIYNPCANYLEDFITAGLKNTLANNFLNSVSYKLPRKKKVKSQTHIRHGNIGILKEHYPLVINTVILD